MRINFRISASAISRSFFIARHLLHRQMKSRTRNILQPVQHVLNSVCILRTMFDSFFQNDGDDFGIWCRVPWLGVRVLDLDRVPRVPWLGTLRTRVSIGFLTPALHYESAEKWNSYWSHLHGKTDNCNVLFSDMIRPDNDNCKKRWQHVVVRYQ